MVLPRVNALGCIELGTGRAAYLLSLTGLVMSSLLMLEMAAS
jgi:hypothetical protein